MKKIISVNNNSTAADIGLLIARFGVAVLMLTHGLPKLVMLFSGAAVTFPPVMGMSPELSLGLAVFAEVLCSLFLLAGFLTRLATIPLIVTMLIAALLIHAPDAFAVKEASIQYLLVYVVLLISGSGRYSVDNLLQQRVSSVK